MNAKLNEFQIIRKFFSSKLKDPTVILGVGDDAALVKIDPKQVLVICVDTLVENVHFLKQTKPEDIAYKSVAVNLSDLAAMGAKPKWITLSLTLPEANEKWLQRFNKGLRKICDEFQISLIGGDTTRGPLSVTVQALGVVPKTKALKRKGAKVGDKVFVSKKLGIAALGLRALQKQTDLKGLNKFVSALNRPKPEIQLGLILQNFASACIDISDGFLADLNHILAASKVGAEIDLAKLPLPSGQFDESIKMQAALTGGDDYALCFTVPENKILLMQKKLNKQNLDYFEVGIITRKNELCLLNQENYKLDLKDKGFDHFHENLK